jgi:hypothetical protein
MDKLSSPDISVADKQKYIDSFARQDPSLQDSAKQLLQLAQDKMPLVQKWAEQEDYSDRACRIYYGMAIQADGKGDNASAVNY